MKEDYDQLHAAARRYWLDELNSSEEAINVWGYMLEDLTLSKSLIRAIQEKGWDEIGSLLSLEFSAAVEKLATLYADRDARRCIDRTHIAGSW